MKYIRTKDGIFEISQAYSDNERITIFFDSSREGVRGLAYILPNNEIQVADTIEELCDEFVYRKIVCPKIECFEGCENKQEIYGAIWTDKGLIYVAKMNDKGELELL